MADYITATMAGLRAALLADAGLVALVGQRVVDEPATSIAFPYVRFGRIEPVQDDTDGTLGGIVQVGLEVHSRPEAGGRTEAARICGAIRAALHRQDTLTVPDFTLSEIEVQTWTVERLQDGASYEGRVALQVHLDA